MGRLDQMWKSTPPGQGRLLVYLMAGDPSPQKSLEYARAVLQHADAIEIGVPFSDPVADGPVIERAGVRALANGASPADAFGLAATLRSHTQKPILVMTYYNPILQVGLKPFAATCRATGVDGVIVPDLPVEESGPLTEALAGAGVDLVQLAAPSSPDKRLRKLGEATRGFLYLVGAYGVTGARAQVGNDATALVARAKAAAPNVPVAVGFGVSAPDHVAALVKAGANGVIVGSAVVKRIEDGQAPEEVAAFVKSLKEGTVGA
ncbi:MAG TPA: tryptophan synthase subunit alpha [Candidatus Thermoplasmatota archaeon]|nr:tryptophan synthase subunit alpha [Candidatus Thermoplasmatota archaeon]